MGSGMLSCRHQPRFGRTRPLICLLSQTRLIDIGPRLKLLAGAFRPR